jgi:hypothetical protein
VATIAKPVLLSQRYGTHQYATLAGLLVIPTTLAKATAPLAAAVLHAGAGSYTLVLIAIAAYCAIAAAAIRLVANRPSISAARENTPGGGLPEPNSTHNDRHH